MGTIMGSMGMNAMQGGLDMVAGEMEQAAGAIEQAASGLEQAVSGAGGGNQQPQQMGGVQNLEQEVSQALQGLSQELQQLAGGNGNTSHLAQQVGQAMGGVNGGGQPQGGSPAQAGAPTPSGGQSPVLADSLPSGTKDDVNDMIADASGDNGKGIAKNLPGDMDKVREDMETEARTGQVSEQAAAGVIEDIDSGNIQGAEQKLTGTSGPVSANAQSYINQ